MASTSKGTKLGKSIAAGLKRAIRESHVPITKMEATVYVLKDNGEYVRLYLNGVPPFTTVVVDDNGDVKAYEGHAEINPL